MICMIWFSKFSNALPAFICASAISILWAVCLGVHSLDPFLFFTLQLASDATLHND